MAKGQLVGDFGYLVRVMGVVHIRCQSWRDGPEPLRERMCGNSRAFTTDELVAEHGPDTTVQAWFDRLRCSKCGSADLSLSLAPRSHEYRQK